MNAMIKIVLVSALLPMLLSFSLWKRFGTKSYNSTVPDYMRDDKGF